MFFIRLVVVLVVGVIVGCIHGAGKIEKLEDNLARINSVMLSANLDTETQEAWNRYISYMQIYIGLAKTDNRLYDMAMRILLVGSAVAQQAANRQVDIVDARIVADVKAFGQSRSFDPAESGLKNSARIISGLYSKEL